MVIFADDYSLSDMASICNHYVAVTRAKNIVVIFKLNNGNAFLYQNNINKLFSKNKLELSDVVSFQKD